MVCLPQISHDFFVSKKLGIVIEERFVFLKEDLADNAAFFHKLNLAFQEVNHWHTDPFDAKTMLEVRKLFEVDVSIDEDQQRVIKAGKRDYSRFYYIPGQGELNDVLPEMVEQYSRGCKLYAVFASALLMQQTVQSIDIALSARGLVREKDNLKIAFSDDSIHAPKCGDHSLFSLLSHRSILFRNL